MHFNISTHEVQVKLFYRARQVFEPKLVIYNLCNLTFVYIVMYLMSLSRI